MRSEIVIKGYSGVLELAFCHRDKGTDGDPVNRQTFVIEKSK